MYQTFEVVLRAVPRQSLRARSKCESAPGPARRAVVDSDRDGQDVRSGNVVEGDLQVVGRDREPDIVAARLAALAVVHVPLLIDGDLALVGARGSAVVSNV